MSRPLRFLFAWELGENYGHLVRCLPIALRLKALGHEVLFAVRDSRGAAELLSAHRIPFVQAPRLQRMNRSARAQVNYSDMLLGEGYQDPLALQGAVKSWLSLFQLCKPDVLIADHAPTALLSARVDALPAAMLGSGFEIPPDVSPLPSIRLGELVADEHLHQADAVLLSALNTVLKSFRRAILHSVCDLFKSTLRILATFPELDHFGPRLNANYVGVFYSLNAGQRVEWPSGEGKRILVYLRPKTPGFGAVLEVLRSSSHRIVFAAPGTHQANVRRFNSTNLHFLNSPVALQPLLGSADVAIGYGSAGFMTQALRSGIPQLMLPQFSEQQLGAKKLVDLGAGLVVGSKRDAVSCGDLLAQLIAGTQYKNAALEFAGRYRSYDANAEADRVARLIAELP